MAANTSTGENDSGLGVKLLLSIYGYEPEEVVGKANSSILHTPEHIAAGKPAQILAAALQAGKWEGT